MDISSQDLRQPSITKISLKTACVKFHSYFPRANELCQIIYQAGYGLYHRNRVTFKENLMISGL